MEEFVCFLAFLLTGIRLRLGWAWLGFGLIILVLFISLAGCLWDGDE